MPFKENLLKKIEIEALGAQVISTIGAPDSGCKVDRKTMIRLLEMADFSFQKERDLDLYVRPTTDGKQDILVLDNELPLYRTDIADVVLRKSPTLKEMVSIRNAIKILNDKDVVLAKRAASVQKIKDELIDALDLTFSAEDVAGIVNDGIACLEKAYIDGVEESLLLLATMLGYHQAPFPFAIKHQYILGVLSHEKNSQILFGPMVAYNRAGNILRWMDRRIDATDKTRLAEWREEIVSDSSFDIAGKNVFPHLAALIKPALQE